MELESISTLELHCNKKLLEWAIRFRNGALQLFLSGH